MAEFFAYTDGACSGNPGPGGWGALLVAVQDGAVVRAEGPPEGPVHAGARGAPPRLAPAPRQPLAVEHQVEPHWLKLMRAGSSLTHSDHRAKAYRIDGSQASTGRVVSTNRASGKAAARAGQAA